MLWSSLSMCPASCCPLELISLELTHGLSICDATCPAQQSVWIRTSLFDYSWMKAALSLVNSLQWLYTDLVNADSIQDLPSHTAHSGTIFQSTFNSGYKYELDRPNVSLRHKLHSPTAIRIQTYPAILYAPGQASQTKWVRMHSPILTYLLGQALKSNSLQHHPTLKPAGSYAKLRLYPQSPRLLPNGMISRFQLTNIYLNARCHNMSCSHALRSHASRLTYNITKFKFLVCILPHYPCACINKNAIILHHLYSNSECKGSRTYSTNGSRINTLLMLITLLVRAVRGVKTRTQCYVHHE